MIGVVGLLGRTSFIGGVLHSRLVAAGTTVVGASSADCDLLDAAATRRFVHALPPGASLVVCSTINKWVDDSFEAFVKNARMVDHLVAALTGRDVAAVVFLSSVDVYGLQPALPITECTLPAPATFYGAAKLACETLLRRPRVVPCPVTVLRLPGVYGADDGGRSVVGGLLRRLLAGEPIHVRGGGVVRRDYVHVNDVCDVVVEALRRRPDGILNVATGESLMLREIIAVLGEVASVSPRLVAEPPDAAAAGDLVFATDLLRATLPGPPLRRLREGVHIYLATLREAGPGAAAANVGAGRRGEIVTMQSSRGGTPGPARGGRA